jgi:hypothetical protein
MENSEKFINWLEGFLDAGKNNITASQIKEIRKKIKAYHEQEKNDLVPIYDTLSTWGQFDGNSLRNTVKEPEVNEEYLKEIEKNKSISTMEELIG